MKGDKLPENLEALNINASPVGIQDLSHSGFSRGGLPQLSPKSSPDTNGPRLSRSRGEGRRNPQPPGTPRDGYHRNGKSGSPVVNKKPTAGSEAADYILNGANPLPTRLPHSSLQHSSEDELNAHRWSAFKDVSFRTDTLGHGLQPSMGRDRGFLDFVVPPGKVEMHFGTSLVQTVPKPGTPGKPAGTRLVQSDTCEPVALSPFLEPDLIEKNGMSKAKLLHTGEQRSWYMNMFPDRQLTGRQDTVFLVNWLKERLGKSAQESEKRRAQKALERKQREAAKSMDERALELNDSKETWRKEQDYDHLLQCHSAYTSCVYELCRQVSTHCVERGRLLAHCWQGVAKIVFDIMEDNKCLQGNMQDIQAIKKELIDRFLQSKQEMKDQYNQLMAECVVYRERYIQLKDDVKDQNQELIELRKMKEQFERVPKLEAEVEELKKQVEDMSKEIGVQQLQLKTAKENTIIMERKLTEAENSEQKHKKDNGELVEQMRCLTPRLERNFVPPANMLSSKQREELDAAFSMGVEKWTLFQMMNSGPLRKYQKYVGILQGHESITREDLIEVLRKGKLATLEHRIDELSMKVIMSMLHHSIAADQVAMVLFGLSASNDDIVPYKHLLGCCANEFPDQVQDMIDKAGMSNAERHQTLIADNKDLRNTVDDLKHRLRQLQETLRTKLNKEEKRKKPVQKVETKFDAFLKGDWKDTFTGLGNGNDVPKFLRTTSKVRNRMMAKRDTEKLVKEIWQEKNKADAGKGEVMSLMDFVHVHLQKKVGISAAILEWGYSFMYGLKQYSYDADCELFLKILTGEVNEDVYQDQVQLQKTISDLMLSMDYAANGGKAVGTLSKIQLQTALRSFFPHKTSDRLKELYKALDKDQPGKEVVYAKLFEEDREFNQGEFAECVRDQQLEERLEYLDELEEAFYDYGDDQGFLDTDAVERAFRKVDKSISKEQLKIYVERCFLSSPGAGEKKEEPTVEISVAMSRIRKGVVKKETESPADGGAIMGMVAGFFKKSLSGPERANIAVNSVKKKWLVKAQKENATKREARISDGGTPLAADEIEL